MLSASRPSVSRIPIAVSTMSSWLSGRRCRALFRGRRQGGGGISVVPVMAHSSFRTAYLAANGVFLASSDLGQDVAREQREVVQVLQVEHLQVDPLGTGLGELADLVYDLVRRAGEAALPQFAGITADRVGALPELCLVSPAADDLRGGHDDR